MAKDYSKNKRMTGEKLNRTPEYTEAVRYGEPVPALTEFDLMNTCFGKNVEQEIENPDEWCERQ